MVKYLLHFLSTYPPVTVRPLMKVEMMDFYTSRSATALEFVNFKEYARNMGKRITYVPRGAVNGAAFFSIWYTIGHIGCNVVRIREEVSWSRIRSVGATIGVMMGSRLGQ